MTYIFLLRSQFDELQCHRQSLLHKRVEETIRKIFNLRSGKQLEQFS